MTKTKKKTAVKNLDQAVTRLTACKEEINEKFKVKNICIFGSLARGESKRGSDIDILVEYRELPNFFEYARLERYLEGILKKKVDLVEKTSIREEIKKHIGGDIVRI